MLYFSVVSTVHVLLCAVLIQLASCTVTEENGHLSHVATLAHDLCTVCTTDHVMVHVTTQRLSYQTQQTMILTHMFHALGKSSFLQQVVQTITHGSVSFCFNLCFVWFSTAHCSNICCGCFAIFFNKLSCFGFI